MTNTARLSLPLLEPGQAQKEMFHNSALALLDLAVQAAAVGAGENVPPAAPEPGECWIVGPAPEGDWAGRAGQVAGWTTSGWRYVAPREGTRVWLGLSQGTARFSGGAWRLGEQHGKLFVEAQQVVGTRQPGIVEPTGGAVVDGEARAAITAVLTALRAHGLVETT